MSIEHAMNLLGAVPTASWWQVALWMRPGKPVTIVQWDGCMATVRNEQFTGKFVRKQDGPERGPGRKYPGIIVEHGGKEHWYALSDLRFTQSGNMEVWR